MMMTSMHNCSILGMTGGVIMMALPIIALIAVVYLIAKHPQARTE
jgi:preprotein translocase subunit YajC